MLAYEDTNKYYSSFTFSKDTLGSFPVYFFPAMWKFLLPQWHNTEMILQIPARVPGDPPSAQARSSSASAP